MLENPEKPNHKHRLLLGQYSNHVSAESRVIARVHQRHVLDAVDVAILTHLVREQNIRKSNFDNTIAAAHFACG